MGCWVKYTGLPAFIRRHYLGGSKPGVHMAITCRLQIYLWMRLLRGRAVLAGYSGVILSPFRTRYYFDEVSLRT